MGWFDDSQQDHEQFHNEGKFSHELVAGAASFEGFKLWEDHQRKEGKTVNHAFAKELLAGFVGGEVDKLAETKGRDEWDRHEDKERIKKQARERASNMYDEHYGNQDDYNPRDRDPPQNIQRYDNYQRNYDQNNNY